MSFSIYASMRWNSRSVPGLWPVSAPMRPARLWGLSLKLVDPGSPNPNGFIIHFPMSIAWCSHNMALGVWVYSVNHIFRQTHNTISGEKERCWSGLWVGLYSEGREGPGSVLPELSCGPSLRAHNLTSSSIGTIHCFSLNPYLQSDSIYRGASASTPLLSGCCALIL